MWDAEPRRFRTNSAREDDLVDDVTVGATDTAHSAIPIPASGTAGSALLPGVRVLERRVFRDTRGSFSELWRLEESLDAGLPRFVQDNLAVSRRGVLRGLHFQHPNDQAKLVSVALGTIYDVVVDVRAGSPTFGQWMAVELSDQNGRQLFVPAGFAHGYQTISEESVVTYKCSGTYSPADEHTIRWDDPRLGIPWPVATPICSPRDAAGVVLHDQPLDQLPRFDR